MPAKSDGSPWIKLKKSCVGTPNRAVYALFCAIRWKESGPHPPSKGLEIATVIENRYVLGNERNAESRGIWSIIKYCAVKRPGSLIFTSRDNDATSDDICRCRERSV
jgi:hypothetical protein